MKVFLQKLTVHLVAASYTKTEQGCSLEDLKLLSGKSFPLCMRQSYRALKKDHHLKHGARQQLGLFLKGVKFVDLLIIYIFFW